MTATTADALTLIDEAWRTRYAAMKSSPSQAEWRQVAARVRDDLAKAADICRAIGAKRELSIALGKLAQMEEGDEKRRERHEEQIAVARESGDAMCLAHAVRHLGDLYHRAGNRRQANECYDEALALYGYEESPPMLDYANALRPMAILKGELGEMAEAKALMRRAGELYRALGIAAGVEEAESFLRGQPCVKRD